jgi:hypothetical protein
VRVPTTRRAERHPDATASRPRPAPVATPVRRAALLAAAVPLALGLAACGGDGDEGVETSTTPTTTFYDRVFGGPEDAVAEGREYEELIRVCMVDQGFEYIPYEQEIYDPSEAALEQEQWREQYGYGISTYVGEDVPSMGEYVDPNQDYLDSLSEANLAAYNEALWGESYDEPYVEGTEPPPPSGCAAEASDQVWGDDARRDESLYEDLDEMEQAIQADERLVAAKEDWSACMEEAGFSYETQDDIYDDLNAQMSEIMGWDTGGGGVTVATAMGVGKAAAVDQEPAPGVWATDETIVGGEPQDYDEAALEELQTYELSVAEADDACTEEHVADVEAEVREDHQADFLEEHPDL